MGTKSRSNRRKRDLKESRNIAWRARRMAAEPYHYTRGEVAIVEMLEIVNRTLNHLIDIMEKKDT